MQPTKILKVTSSNSYCSTCDHFGETPDKPTFQQVIKEQFVPARGNEVKGRFQVSPLQFAQDQMDLSTCDTHRQGADLFCRPT